MSSVSAESQGKENKDDAAATANLERFKWKGMQVIKADCAGKFNVIDWSQLGGEGDQRTDWSGIVKGDEGIALNYPPMQLTPEYGSAVIIARMFRYGPDLIVYARYHSKYSEGDVAVQNVPIKMVLSLTRVDGSVGETVSETVLTLYHTWWAFAYLPLSSWIELDANIPPQILLTVTKASDHQKWWWMGLSSISCDTNGECQPIDWNILLDGALNWREEWRRIVGGNGKALWFHPIRVSRASDTHTVIAVCLRLGDKLCVRAALHPMTTADDSPLPAQIRVTIEVKKRDGQTMTIPAEKNVSLPLFNAESGSVEVLQSSIQWNELDSEECPRGTIQVILQ